MKVYVPDFLQVPEIYIIEKKNGYLLVAYDSSNDCKVLSNRQIPHVVVGVSSIQTVGYNKSLFYTKRTVNKVRSLTRWFRIQSERYYESKMRVLLL